MTVQIELFHEGPGPCRGILLRSPWEESKTPGELPPETRAADWQGSDSLSAQDLQLPLVRREQNSVRKTEWEIRPCTGTMRTLVILTLLAVLVVAATSYESHESMESHEYLNPFLNRRRANDFIQADTRLRAITQERIRERSKAPQEHQRELCEDYYPCEMYAFRHGYAAAYKHYFGGRRRTK